MVGSTIGGILAAVLTVRMNDLAARALDVLSGFGCLEPPGGLAAGLCEQAGRGIARRGEVVTWDDSSADYRNAPSFFADLSSWEASDSSFHLEDFVSVGVTIVDDQPLIGEGDQQVLLMHGAALARMMSRMVYGLTPSTAVRFIVGANETNATFRFHRIRAGEYWSNPDLDAYREDKMIVVDVEPPGHGDVDLKHR